MNPIRAEILSGALSRAEFALDLCALIVISLVALIAAFFFAGWIWRETQAGSSRTALNDNIAAENDRPWLNDRRR